MSALPDGALYITIQVCASSEQACLDSAIEWRLGRIVLYSELNAVKSSMRSMRSVRAKLERQIAVYASKYHPSSHESCHNQSERRIQYLIFIASIVSQTLMTPPLLPPHLSLLNPLPTSFPQPIPSLPATVPASNLPTSLPTTYPAEKLIALNNTTTPALITHVISVGEICCSLPGLLARLFLLLESL